MCTLCACAPANTAANRGKPSGRLGHRLSKEGRMLAGGQHVIDPLRGPRECGCGATEEASNRHESIHGLCLLDAVAIVMTIAVSVGPAREAGDHKEEELHAPHGERGDDDPLGAQRDVDDSGRDEKGHQHPSQVVDHVTCGGSVAAEHDGQVRDGRLEAAVVDAESDAKEDPVHVRCAYAARLGRCTRRQLGGSIFNDRANERVPEGFPGAEAPAHRWSPSGSVVLASEAAPFSSSRL
eukprot:888423-Prymnesium_polylepis.1